jgi:hypothetical protein
VCIYIVAKEWLAVKWDNILELLRQVKYILGSSKVPLGGHLLFRGSEIGHEPCVLSWALLRDEVLVL